MSQSKWRSLERQVKTKAPHTLTMNDMIPCPIGERLQMIDATEKLYQTVFMKEQYLYG